MREYERERVKHGAWELEPIYSLIRRRNRAICGQTGRDISKGVRIRPGAAQAAGDYDTRYVCVRSDLLSEKGFVRALLVHGP